MNVFSWLPASKWSPFISTQYDNQVAESVWDCYKQISGLVYSDAGWSILRQATQQQLFKCKKQPKLYNPLYDIYIHILAMVFQHYSCLEGRKSWFILLKNYSTLWSSATCGRRIKTMKFNFVKLVFYDFTHCKTYVNICLT